MTDLTHVVVGAGQAGATAVKTLREAGETGRVVLVGEERDEPYERPELSKGYLSGDKDRSDLGVLEAGWYAANDVELLTGRRAVRVDRAAHTVELDEGEPLAYDRLLLATGSAPRRLKIEGGDLPGVHYLRRVGNSDAIREAIRSGGPLVVIGGGWIGLEVAAVARQKGLDVTVLEATAQPLSRVLGEEVGARIAALHEHRGTGVRTGVVVKALRGREKVKAVELDDGTLVEAGAVVVGVGIRPRTELAEEAGLEVDDGVVVDATLATSDPAIFAAGDVAHAANEWAGRSLRVEHYANANDQGPFAARNMAGAGERWARPPFFWSDQYDAGMEYRGWADPASSRLVLRGGADDAAWMAFWLDGERVVAGLHVNGWDDADTLKKLVTEKATVDPARLADPKAPLA